MYKSSETLCWYCSKACGGCRWSDKRKPVNGWKAKKMVYECSYRDDSYIVTLCPEFVPDDYESVKDTGHILAVETGRVYKTIHELCKELEQISKSGERYLCSHICEKRRKSNLFTLFGKRYFVIGESLGKTGRRIRCKNTGNVFISMAQAARWVVEKGISVSKNERIVRKMIARVVESHTKEGTPILVYGQEWELVDE